MFQIIVVSENRLHSYSISNLPILKSLFDFDISLFYINSPRIGPVSKHFHVRLFGISCCTNTELYDNLIIPPFPSTLGCRRFLYIILPSILSCLCPSLSLVALCQTVKARGKSCLCPGPEEQLHCKPAKLTRSP